MANPSLDDLLKQIEEESASGLSINSSGGEELPPKVSAGMKEVAVHEDAPTPASPSPLNMDMGSNEIPQITRQFIGGGAVVSDNVQVPGLTARQKALPKLSFRMLGTLAAMLVLVAGLGSAVVLTQQSQDVRQYAYDPAAKTDPNLQQYMADESVTGDQAAMPDKTGDQMPEVAQDTTSQTAVTLPVTTNIWWQNPLLIAGAAVVLSALLILAVFLHWLFAV